MSSATAPHTTSLTGAPVETSPTAALNPYAPTADPVQDSLTGVPRTTSPTAAPVETSPTAALHTTAPTAGPVQDSLTAVPRTLSATAAPVTASPTDAPLTSSLAASPPDAPLRTAPEKKCDQQRGAVGGKCDKECSLGDGTCPDGCQSSNPVYCSDGKCTLSKKVDPTKVELITSDKDLSAALSESPGKPSCKEGDKKQCEQNLKAQCEGRCPLSGDCDGSKQDSSLVLWHPNQGSPGGSPKSQTAEQKGETRGPKGGLQPCAHPEDNIHKQEEHHKICSPLPQGDKLKAVLFDIDGTIADSDPIHFLAFQEVLAEAGYNGGVPISHEFFIRQMSGKLNYVIAEELMPEMDEKKRIEMMDEKEVRYRKLAAKDLQPIPGFLKFSEYVKQRGLRRAAVTNSPRLNAEQVIAALKIPDFFDTIVVGSECDNPKPSPDPYLKAIKFLGVEANQCFVLEDSPSGVKAGRAAGSPVVGLLTGHPGPVLRDNGASVLIQDYHDSALWIALGENHNACHGSQGQDSTPSTGVPAPAPIPA